MYKNSGIRKSSERKNKYCQPIYSDKSMFLEISVKLIIANEYC